MPFPSANLAQFLYTIDAKNIFAVLVFFLKKVHNILLYEAEQFYVNNKMAAEWKPVKFFAVKA